LKTTRVTASVENNFFEKIKSYKGEDKVENEDYILKNYRAESGYLRLKKQYNNNDK